MKRSFLLLLLLVAVVFPLAIAATAGAVFFWTHPNCEVCGRRYGPLISHPYRHKPNTSRISADELARARATAPVINSLPPLTDANRNLTLSPELLAGRWESQDGDRLPIHFHADGTVEVGFVRENGRWLMSQGVYQIQGDRVATQTQHKGVSLNQFFNFAHGVLYAPRGPSPQVVWKRVSDQE